MKVLKGKKKKMIEGREKPVWNDVGFTLLIGDWEGRTTYTLVDERTGEKYSMFDVDYKKRDGGGAVDAPVAAVPIPEDADDVPF
jgi:hypothetical protein